MVDRDIYHDPRLGSSAPPSTKQRIALERAHARQAWDRAKKEVVGDGASAPRRFSWEQDAT